MLSLSNNKHTDIIVAFISTSRYLDNSLCICYHYFEQMVVQLYKLNKANSYDTEAPFLIIFRH